MVGRQACSSESPASGLISLGVMLPKQLYDPVRSLSAVLLEPPEQEMFCQMVWGVILISKPALPCQPRTHIQRTITSVVLC